MAQLLAIHLVMAIGAPFLVRFLGRKAFLVLALAPATAVAYALSHTADVMRGEHPTVVHEWIPVLDIELAFRMDTLAWLMLLLVGGVGVGGAPTGDIDASCAMAGLKAINAAQ